MRFRSSLRAMLRVITLVLFCALNAEPLQAAIDIDLDIQGSDATANTSSKKVSVSRIELSFPNNRQSQTVPLNESGLYARARFKYLGNGALIARWKVDGRVVAQTSEILTFGREVEIRSSKNNVYLPTFERGAHQVSLELRNSSGLIAESSKSISYFVADGVAGIKSGDGIQLMYPARIDVDVAQGFYFRWKGPKNIKLYQLEVESLADSGKGARQILQAYSDIDAFKPSAAQRAAFDQTGYRWRVRGLYKDKYMKPLESEWVQFSASNAKSAGGLFISSLATETVALPTKVNSPAINPALSSSLSAIPSGQKLFTSKHLVSRQSVTAGQPYTLKLNVQNGQTVDSGPIQVRVSRNGEVMGSYPVAVAADQRSEVAISLMANPAVQPVTSVVDVEILRDGKVLDTALINLTEAPGIRFDEISFIEVAEAPDMPYLQSPYSCNNRQPSASSYLARMVSARLGNAAQSLLQQGHFSFDQGQSIRFNAYFKDQGIGDWMLAQAEQCGVAPGMSAIERTQADANLAALGAQFEQCYQAARSDKSRAACVTRYRPQVEQLQQQIEQYDFLNGSVVPLQFSVQKLNNNGEPEGALQTIGPVYVGSGFDGLVESPEWTIPQSGQYRVSLGGLSNNADLYATQPGGLPLYLNASGFDIELNGLAASSRITSASPRQALLSGQGQTRWRGDAANNRLNMVFDNIAVTMQDPLHARLDSGVVQLSQAAQPVPLRLMTQGFQLRDLTLEITAATANLAYRVFTAAKPLELPDVEIFNGGEFIARYRFDDQWEDTLPRKGDQDLALRLRGGELIVDASPHLNFDDYSQQTGFVGIGLHDVLLRARVTAANDLFEVLNNSEAFLYGRANWLELTANSLNGEDIEVLAAEQVAPFFNQAATSEWHLQQPFGFKLTVLDGVFGLNDSRIGGLDLAGYFSIPDSVNTGITTPAEITFSHLQRRFLEDATGQAALFATEQITNNSLSFNNGVFRYQPQFLQLQLGRYATTEALPTLNRKQVLGASPEDLDKWYTGFSAYLGHFGGLLLGQGQLDKGWQSNDASDTAAQANHAGAFLLTSNGLEGYWVEGRSGQPWLISGFNSVIDGLSMYFRASQLVDSWVQGRFDLPYPLDLQFSFDATLDQEAGLQIAQNGLSLPEAVREQGYFDLAHWHARLYLNEPANPLLIKGATPGSRLLFDEQNQRIVLDRFDLELMVGDAYGGAEFQSGDGSHPFRISTNLLPNGQLEESVIDVDDNLYFIGQRFTPGGANPVQFQPYVGNGTAPPADAAPSAQPLVTVQGALNFVVFGEYQVDIEHTAVGARVSDIDAPEVAVEENSVKVKADLRFVNTWGLNAQGVSEFVNSSNAPATSEQGTAEAKPFKAFVGTADLSLINAVSIKGLAEAGLHNQQAMVSDREALSDGTAIWADPEEDIIKAYERVGLGAGADILKATLAGVRGLETATRIGSDIGSAALGVDGLGEKVVNLGVETASFIESVGMATAVSVATGGAASTEITHAIDNGLATTNSAIELVKFICEEKGSQSDCQQKDIPLYLDILSLLTRTTSGALHIEDLANNKKEVASLTLQTLDVAIPVLKGEAVETALGHAGMQVNLDVGNENIISTKNAALSSAHVAVGAARKLVDQNMALGLRDILMISRRSVTALDDISRIPEVRNNSNAELMDLTVALASESIDLVEQLDREPNIARLQRVASDYVKLLCQHSSALGQISGLQQVGDQVIEPTMSLTAALLDKVSLQGPVGDGQQIVGRFLVTLLQELAQGSPSVSGCQSQHLSAQLPLLKPLFLMAAHSLKPLAGGVHNEGELIAWALDGISLSLQSIDGIVTQAGGSLPDTAGFEDVLQKLAHTFASANLDLSNSDTQQQSRAVLNLAGQLPQAFRAQVAGVSPEAAELLDIHSALMRELLGLLNKEPAQRGLGDAIQLSTNLIAETQDLSLLTNEQKYALSSLAHVLSIIRGLADGQLNIGVINDHLQRLHGNLQSLDTQGLLSAVDVGPLFATLDLTELFSTDPQQATEQLSTHLAKLIPLVAGASQQVLEPARAVVAALPIVDFTQDDRVATLDATLNRLLNEAESKTPDNANRQAIQRARSIINHADFSITGLSWVEDEQGNRIGVKEVMPDGRLRSLEFASGQNFARQHYPEGYPIPVGTRCDGAALQGGLDEATKLVFGGDLADFEALPAENRESLFTAFWDQEFFASTVEPLTRKYRDCDGNLIEAEFLGENSAVVKTTSAVSIDPHTLYRIFSADDLPPIGEAMAEVNLGVSTLFEAAYELDVSSGYCDFSGGCVSYWSAHQMVKVHPRLSKHEFALYSAQDDISGRVEDISVNNLLGYKGRINATIDGWDSGWIVNFTEGSGGVTISDASGNVELLSFTSAETGIDSAVQLAQQIMASVDQLIVRRVTSGSDYWEFVPGIRAFHRNSDTGEWTLYSMSDLPNGTRVPAPNELIPLDILTLQASGNRDGIQDDPAGLSSTVQNGFLQLPSEDSSGGMTIPVTGDHAGEPLINGVPADIAGDLQDSGIDPADVTDSQTRPYPPENTAPAPGTVSATGTTVSTDDGQRMDFVDVANGGVEIIRQMGPGSRRGTVIRRCTSSEPLPFAQCPEGKKEIRRFDYDWAKCTGREGEYFRVDTSIRPTITPASGANKALKHQLWLEIFRLENDLYGNPTLQGLDRLDTLMRQGLGLALDVEELQAVQFYITLRVSNALIQGYIQEFEQHSGDPAFINRWKTDPELSPVNKVNKLVGRIRQQKLGMGASLSEAMSLSCSDLDLWQEEAFRVENAVGLEEVKAILVNPNKTLTQKLEKTRSVAAAATRYVGALEAIGASGDLAMAEEGCEAVGYMLDYFNTQVQTDHNYVPSQEDLQAMMDLVGGATSLGGCGHNNAMAEVQDLAESHNLAVTPDSDPGLLPAAQGLEAVLRAIRNPTSTINRPAYDLARVEFNTAGNFYNPTPADLTDLFIQQVLQQQNTSAQNTSLDRLEAPNMDKVDQWSDFYFAINTVESVVRDNPSIYFSPTNVAEPLQNLRNTMLDLLAERLIDEYRLKVNDFIDAGETADLVRLQTLFTLREKIQSINTRLKNERDPLVVFNGLNIPAAQPSIPDIFAGISQRQQDWFENHLWRKAGQSSFDATWNKIIRQSEVILYLDANLPDDAKLNLPQYFGTGAVMVNVALDTDMVLVKQALDNATDEAAINIALAPLPEIEAFLGGLGFIDEDTHFRALIQAMIDISMQNITSSPASLELEVRKIAALRAFLGGQVLAAGAQTNSDPALEQALDDAFSALDAALNQIPTTEVVIEARRDAVFSILRRLMSIQAVRQSLGIESGFDADAVPSRLEPYTVALGQALNQSHDLDLVKPYISMITAMQALGSERYAAYDLTPAVTALVYHRDQLLSCQNNNSCSVTHVRTALEYQAQIVALGGNSDNYSMAEIADMIQSTSVAMKQSLRFDREMPDVQQLVYEDKTGNTGRHAAGIVLERLGNSLFLAADGARCEDVVVNTDEASRVAVTAVIRRLRNLAEMPLPAGSIKPEPNFDQLVISANNLQNRLDHERECLANQLTEVLAVSELTPDTLPTIAAAMHLSEEELVNEILPEVNGANEIVRIIPANKYRLAAAELEPYLAHNEAWQALSYRLMNKLPDPAITAEADYRLQAAGQLAVYLLTQGASDSLAQNTSGSILLAQSATGTLSDVSGGLLNGFSDEELLQSPPAQFLIGLLTLPGEQQPAKKLIEMLSQHLINPIITGGDSELSCRDMLCYLFKGGLSSLGIVLDQLIDNANDPTKATLATLTEISDELQASNQGNWLGLAAQGLGIGVNVVKNPADAATGTNVTIEGLDLAASVMDLNDVKRIMQNPAMPTFVPFGLNVVKTATVKFKNQLEGSEFGVLPVALAGIAANALDDSLRPHNALAANITQAVNNWTLGFADNHWDMIIASLQGNNADEWLTALNATSGIPKLSCEINKLHLLGDDIRLPTGVALTPFVTAQRLYHNRSDLGQTEKSPAVLMDLSADLSNLLFVVDSEACDSIVVPEGDQAVATLLRELKNINLNEPVKVMALKTIGNLGIGALSALMPGEDAVLPQVSSLLWNGTADHTGSGVSDFLALASDGQNVGPLAVLEKVETIPITYAALLTVLNENRNDPTARVLAILSGNVSDGDMLAPDTRYNGDAYRIPNSMLAMLGLVREGLKPLSPRGLHYTDDNWGYLRTAPMFSYNQQTYQVELASDLTTGMNDMIQDALALDGAAVANNGAEAAQRVLLAGVDIARLGINGIVPLMNPDPTGQQGIAAVENRAIFSDLAGETAGFSGVTGGYQREWTAGTDEFGDFTFQMYGQLVWPLLGRQNVLMSLDTGSDYALLSLEGAAAVEGVGSMLGGMTGRFTGSLGWQPNAAGQTEFGMSIDGQQKLEILSNTIADLSVSAYFNDLIVSGGENLSIGEYAARQALNLDAGLCGQLEGQVLPFPLSLTGVSGTATAGVFGEKADGMLTLGGRAGLSGSLKLPLFNSLLGITLGGNVTQSYSAGLTENDLFPAASTDICISPKVTLTVAGIDLGTSADIVAEAFVEGGNSAIASGIKLRIGLNKAAIAALSQQEDCNSSVECSALLLLKNASIWVVVRNELSLRGKQQIFAGIGELPEPGVTVPYGFATVSSLGQLSDVGFWPQLVGDWGGFHGAQNLDLCRQNFCGLNEVIQ